MTNEVDGGGSLLSRPRRVLVVDDDVALVESLAIALEMIGHHALGVTSGNAAIATYKTFDPDVVLIDLHVGDLDGATIAAQIRNHAQRRAPLLIAFSGSPPAVDDPHRRGQGFDGCILKPPSIRELERTIQSRSVSVACRRKTDPMR